MCHCFKSPDEYLEQGRNALRQLTRSIFLCMVLLAVRMVADVTETRNVIPSLDFKTCMTIKS